VAAALEVEAQLNLVLEVVLYLGEGGGERWIAEKKIKAENDNHKDEQRFPFEIGVHG
jgi:hypothetical protein